MDWPEGADVWASPTKIYLQILKIPPYAIHSSVYSVAHKQDRVHKYPFELVMGLVPIQPQHKLL